METLKNLTERNFSNSLTLIDCTQGQAAAEERRAVIWNQTKNRNFIATRFTLEQSKDLKNEFFLTFDLGEIAQLSEFQITFNMFTDPYNQNLGQNVKPQMVILEGKKESLFVSSK